jgi:hypothetical protein
MFERVERVEHILIGVNLHHHALGFFVFASLARGSMSSALGLM